MTPQEVEAVARRLENEGFFEQVRRGDTRAASYFARLVAYRCNPTGDPAQPGCLRKGGGHNVDGYAEDAVALNGNPNDFHNVMDLVADAGAPGASVRSANLNPRRTVDVWEAPRPLTPAELAILGKGETPIPAPPTDKLNDAVAEIKRALGSSTGAIIANDDADHQTLADLLGKLNDHLKEQDAAIVDLLTRLEVAIHFAERATKAAEKASTQTLVGRTRAFGGEVRLTPEP